VLSEPTESSVKIPPELTLEEVPPYVQAAVAALDEFQGSEILIMQVGDVLGIVEYFIVTSAPNTRLVRKLVDEVEACLKTDHDMPPLRVEGHDAWQWVLIDYGGLVVHVMLDETRRLYELERLWADVPLYRCPAPSSSKQAP
jgi:ribosome-associated protein